MSTAVPTSNLTAYFLSLLSSSCFSGSDCPDWFVSDNGFLCLICCQTLEANLNLLTDEVHGYTLLSLFQRLTTAHDRCQSMFECFVHFFVDIFICFSEVSSSLGMSQNNVFYACIYQHV